MEADFSGYATKANLKCSDGRTITPEAFSHQDKTQVPLVWQHGHQDIENILGYAQLEHRDDGIYAYGYFNDTPKGQLAKTQVAHKDINALSIFANKLVEKTKVVLHGTIREVSLVLAGANPGALIDAVRVVHADGYDDELEDAAIIFTGLEFEHADSPPVPASPAKPAEKPAEEKPKSEENDEPPTPETVKHVVEGMTEEQKKVTFFLVGAAANEAEAAAAHSEDDGSAEDLNHQEGTASMSRNAFDQTKAPANKDGEGEQGKTLSHSDLMTIVEDAKKPGQTMKGAVEDYAIAHGIENLEVLFPDAKNVTDRPEWDARRTEWVDRVLSGTKHSPFSRIKTLSADITFEDARAKGYIKGNFKKEEFFRVKGRTTTPKTIYKKQQLDRDDIIDITDFDVVAWIKGEMRLMLNEEVARAVLLGDGRAVDDPDKIDEDRIRPIATDDDLYAIKVNIPFDEDDVEVEMDAIIEARELYKGTGQPTLFTTIKYVNRMLLKRDLQGRKLFRNKQEIAAELQVADIVEVEVMNDYPELLGVVVNLVDYTIGADRGGEVSMFDDFDIDYNQYKYLIETRMSGALTKLRSALILRRAPEGDVAVTANIPTPKRVANTITIPTVANTVWKSNGVTKAAGSTVVLDAANPEATITVSPAEGYYLEAGRHLWDYAFQATAGA